MYTAIIFDYFDVIQADVYKAWLTLHGHTREGVFREVVEAMDQGHISFQQFLERLHGITGQLPHEIFAEMERSAVINDDVVQMVAELKRHYRLGLLSNAPSDFIRMLLSDHDLEPYFDEIVISSEVGLIKPNVQIFNLILSRLNVQPQEALFIDDNPHNIAGGEAAGITGILFTNAAALRRDLEILKITL